ncbi:36.4 kDa proline-rich protein-like [Phragmites australis]|uniref:36.4 kDa proline-rich protein-like n=1 Tax=Phragmites australis TaxID=29695 RepID=UPI002D7889A8|nr:36.4 kDa proline-rich protein-like [Phragmites australis]
MATFASVRVLLVLAAVVLPSSLAWNCPPPAPGGHGRPWYPPPGRGSPDRPSPGAGHSPPHHGKPPKHHHNPPSKCPPCNPPYAPPYVPPTPRPPPYVPPTPPYVPPYVPPTPPYVPPTPPYVPPTPPYVPPTPPYVPPTPPPTPPTGRTCPIDALKLNACVDVLGGLIHLVIGREAKSKCCPLVQGIADLDAALCLCTTIRARLLGINIYLPVALELLITCGKHPPPGFQCPPLYASTTEIDHQLRA